MKIGWTQGRLKYPGGPNAFFWEAPSATFFKKMRPFFTARGKVLTFFQRRRHNFDHFLPSEAQFCPFFIAGSEILTVFHRRRHNFDHFLRQNFNRWLVGGPPSEPLARGALMQMHHVHHRKGALVARGYRLLVRATPP
jgi:hypothetical protein